MTARELIIAVFRSISDCFGHSIIIYFREGHEIEKKKIFIWKEHITL